MEAEAMIPFDADWNVIRPVRLAVLDRRFAIRVAPHPEIAAELMRRLVKRARQAMLSMAIVHQPRVETRVEMMLWTLAERWATTRSGGVALSLPLTHALLADLVAASRPAVSAAVSALTKGGRIRREGNVWFLAGTPPGAGSRDALHPS
jgi:CRP-like cAMP-binding protein